MTFDRLRVKFAGLRSREENEVEIAAVALFKSDDEPDVCDEGSTRVERNDPRSGFVRTLRGISSTIEENVRLRSMRLGVFLEMNA